MTNDSAAPVASVKEVPQTKHREVSPQKPNAIIPAEVLSLFPQIKFNPKQKISGIYMILNNINGSVYIGASKNIWRRWESHYVKSSCSSLRREMNSYRRKSFSLSLIEKASRVRLKEREGFWIDHAIRNNVSLYNTLKKSTYKMSYSRSVWH